MDVIEFKTNLLEWFKMINLDSHAGYVSHGGAMLMLGLRELTDDIDLNVGKVVWDNLLEKGYTVKHLSGNGLPPVSLISVTEHIDVHLVTDWPVLMDVDGVLITPPHQIIRDKEELGREKDLKDIKVLEAYLKGM